jgi:hypothetical protein
MLAINSATNLPAQPAPKAGKAAVSEPVKASLLLATPESSASAVKAEAPKEAVQAPVKSKVADSMRFSLGGDDGKQVIIEIYDAEKGVLVRTIPYEAMSEKSKGMVLNVKV